MRKKTRKEDIAPLPPPRVNYKTLMRHEEPGRAREPPEEPASAEQQECMGCPYSAHGFVCWPGDCIRKRMESIQRGGNQDESKNLSDQPGS